MIFVESIPLTHATESFYLALVLCGLVGILTNTRGIHRFNTFNGRIMCAFRTCFSVAIATIYGLRLTGVIDSLAPKYFAGQFLDCTWIAGFVFCIITPAVLAVPFKPDAIKAEVISHLPVAPEEEQ